MEKGKTKKLLITLLIICCIVIFIVIIIAVTTTKKNNIGNREPFIKLEENEGLNSNIEQKKDNSSNTSSNNSSNTSSNSSSNTSSNDSSNTSSNNSSNTSSNDSSNTSSNNSSNTSSNNSSNTSSNNSSNTSSNSSSNTSSNNSSNTSSNNSSNTSSNNSSNTSETNKDSNNNYTDSNNTENNKQEEIPKICPHDESERKSWTIPDTVSFGIGKSEDNFNKIIENACLYKNISAQVYWYGQGYVIKYVADIILNKNVTNSSVYCSIYLYMDDSLNYPGIIRTNNKHAIFADLSDGMWGNGTDASIHHFEITDGGINYYPDNISCLLDYISWRWIEKNR